MKRVLPKVTIVQAVLKPQSRLGNQIMSQTRKLQLLEEKLCRGWDVDQDKDCYVLLQRKELGLEV